MPRPVLHLARVAPLVLAGLLAACTAAPPAGGINDPNEVANRRVHEFNKGLDRAVVRPAATAYGTVVPEPVRLGVGNFASNLDVPRMVVNDVLQGNVEDAVHNTFRFLVNSTFGLAGLLDPASDMGLTARDTDFGETLHVWGAGEGAYVELPVFGPSTQRDAAGRVVDLVLNPLRPAISDNDADGALFGVNIASRLGDRYRFAESIDSILYDSADSYAQSRLLYLESRRFQLGTTGAVDTFDPYEDPFYDPYEDPNVQQ